MKLIYLLFVSFAIFSACCKQKHTRATNNAVSVEKLIFGSFYGECAGNCVNLYGLDRSVLQKADSAVYPSLSRSYEFIPLRTLSNDKYNNAKKLLNEMPEEMLNDNNRTYGAPDSHDQGGIYIEIFQGKTGQRFMIDNDNTSDQSSEVIAFKRKVADVINELR